MRAEARRMEQETRNFYLQAASRTSDAAVRKLLGDLAEAELKHEQTAAEVEAKHLPDGVKGRKDDARAVA